MCHVMNAYHISQRPKEERPSIIAKVEDSLSFGKLRGESKNKYKKTDILREKKTLFNV